MSKALKMKSGEQDHGSSWPRSRHSWPRHHALNEIGGIVIGSSPLLLGLFIFAKGAGIETTVNRVIQEMRENADVAMFSSLLWTAGGLQCYSAGAVGR